MKLYYLNSNAISYSNIDEATGMGVNEAKVSFVSPAGMLAVNKISEYDETGKSIISVNQGTVVDKIKMDSEAIDAKMDLMLINNTGDICNSLKVLGRIPFEGNKKVGTDEDLKTTVNTNMIQGISLDENLMQNAKIYYSENGEATDDLADANNGWVENPSDFSKVKSYLVVFENYEFKQGEIINMSYNFKVPEMIDLNNFLNFRSNLDLEGMGLKGGFVKNYSFSTLIDKICDKYNKDLFETSIGFKYISQKMIDTNSLVGAENSGIEVKGNVYTKDGLVVYLLLLEILSFYKKPLSKIVEEMKSDVGYTLKYREYSFNVENKSKIIRTLQKEIPEFKKEVVKVGHLDGFKYYFKDGTWALVRFSGTEELLRLVCEQKTKKEVDELIAFLKNYTDKIE